MQNSAKRNRHWAILAAALLAAWSASSTAALACVGDCNNDFEVTVDELVTMVNISLEAAPLSGCTAGDSNSDDAITVDEIIQGVNAALLGCITIDGACGNGLKEPPEDCDDGGTCIGGSNAGTHCTTEADCQGSGVCDGGSAVAKRCDIDGDCPGGHCVRCKTFGGDGCAANCTQEQAVPYNLVSGSVDGLAIAPGTSGAVVYGDPLTIPLPLVGSLQLLAGKSTNGIRPFVIPAASVDFPQIGVSTLACACIRGVAFKTCGGTLFEKDGVTLTPSCTQGFLGATTCPEDRPCTFVHGEGNSATGEVACGSSTGLDGIDFLLQQDAGGPDQQPGPVQITISGSGPVGSARVRNSTSIGTSVGRCQPTFCTDADPASTRGTPQTLPFTTGQACCEVINANDDPTFNIGPRCVSGNPAMCSQLDATPPSLSGFSIAGAFTAVDQATVGDICVTTTFVGR